MQASLEGGLGSVKGSQIDAYYTTWTGFRGSGQNDSFMNAFANAQIVPALLSFNIDDAIENALRLHENNRPKYQPLFLHSHV